MGRKNLLFIKSAIVIFVLGLIYVSFLHYKIIHHANIEPVENAEYIIILGARVKGTIPSLALQYRINHAAEYLMKNRDTVAIASGGKGPGEDISEAEAIKKELVAMGIEENRVLLEDQSTSTYENIRYSKELVPDHAKNILVVTNDFHLFRAKMIGKNEDLILGGLPAKTPIQAVIKSYSREYLALTKYFIVTIFSHDVNQD